MNASLNDIAKKIYDHARLDGAAHDAAIDRVAAALPVISPRATPAEVAATAAFLREQVRSQEAPTVMQGELPFAPWFEPSMKDGWLRWRRYRRYLLEKKGWAFDSVAALDASSDDIVRQLGDPASGGAFDRHGLVVGSVQSGKTASYMALMSKALDAGYSVVIVLAGIHNSLRHQTQTRIDDEIVGIGTQLGSTQREVVGVGLLDPRAEHPPMQYLTGRGEDGDFSAQVARKVGVHLGQTPLLLVVKKNVVVLENLISYLRGLPVAVNVGHGMKQLQRIPLLLIDDEADQASINFRPVRGDLDEFDPSLDPSRVNEQIRKLLVTFAQRTYVGYTATPFANVLIPPEGVHPMLGPDLFPRDFIVALHPPDDYIGPRQVFGTGLLPDGTEVTGMPVVRVVSDHEKFIPEKHRQEHAPTAVPSSLRNAVLSYLIAGAVRCCRGQSTRHHTLLVHVTRFTAVQQRVASLIERLLARLCSILEYGSGAPGTPESPGALLAELRSVWDRDFVLTSGAMNASLPPWELVQQQLLPGLRRVSLRIINGDAADVLDYERQARGGAWVIAVGGDKLSRGLTLEGLCVSYYLRASRTYDTLMQMGRWFGYRPGYADLCRIFTTAELVSWFQHIVQATEELWDEFETMQRLGSTPRQFGLRVMAHPAIEVTSPMKMREAERISLNYSGAVQETIMFDLAADVTAANHQAVHSFVVGLGEPAPRENNRGPYLWRDIPAANTLQFLRAYRTHRNALTVISSRLADYVEQHVPRGILTTWMVAVMSTKQPIACSGTGTAGGRVVDRFQRAILTDVSTPDCTRIRRMLSPDDELLDIDETELGLLARHRKGKSLQDPVTAQDARGYDVEGPPPMRIGRPASRGLLILYPLVLGPKGADLRGNPTIWGMALSFPRSSQLLDHEFVANPVWLEQMNAG
ncbi:Z1 domain-containing protein [Sorangium sp. So ce362]|uniref:Z1 domain-containing protein n=1 Tax=Sorangium sp. So ce362 TaxID=3133303 RepID=UPI003F607251